MLSSSKINLSSKKFLLVSLTNSAGGAEQILNLVSNYTDSPMLFLKKVLTNQLVFKDTQKVNFVTSGSLFFGFLKLPFSLYKRRDNSIIFSSHPYLNAYLGFLKRIGYIKSPLIARECTSVFTRFSGLKKLSYSIAYRFGYSSIDLIICQSKIMRDQLLDHNGYLNQEKVIVQDNPIDVKLVKYRALQPVPDLPLSSDFICTAGRLIPIKGFSNLIKAFAQIKDEFPSLKLLIFGSGPEKNSLSELIDSLNLGNRVFLKGYTENPYPYFKAAKMCIVSSIQEGFPNVLLQMMALNTSVLTTLCAGGIEDIDTVVKVPANDVDGLAEGLRITLETGTEYNREQMDNYLRLRTPEIFIGSLLNKIG